MTGIFKPSVPESAAAPAPTPETKTKRLETEASTTSRTEAKQKKKGRSGLKIDLQGGNAGADGTGINVPRA